MGIGFIHHFIDGSIVPEEYFDTLRQFTKYDFSSITEENESAVIPDNPDDEDKGKLEVDGD